MGTLQKRGLKVEIIFKTKKPLEEYKNLNLSLTKATVKNNATGSTIVFISELSLNFEFSEEEIKIEEQNERKIINYTLTAEKVEVTIEEEKGEITFLILNNQIFQ